MTRTECDEWQRRLAALEVHVEIIGKREEPHTFRLCMSVGSSLTFWPQHLQKEWEEKPYSTAVRFVPERRVGLQASYLHVIEATLHDEARDNGQQRLQRLYAALRGPILAAGGVPPKGLPWRYWWMKLLEILLWDDPERVDAYVAATAIGTANR